MRKVLFLLLLLVGLGVANMSAQVRIGGDGEPHTAAVLDLNVDNSDDGNNGGLALPRVELIDNTTQLNGTAPTKGMLVYNTNSDMANGQGTGVYYWNGSVWMVVAGDVGAFGPNAVNAGSTNSYKTWCFPAYTKLGCWTIDNSRETPAAGTTYSGQAANASGSYYTWAQAAGACTAITGYVLPNEAQWTALRDYINGPNSTTSERQNWLFGSALAGFYRISSKSWNYWGVRGYWWCSGSSSRTIVTDGAMAGPDPSTDNWFPVRCVKS